MTIISTQRFNQGSSVIDDDGFAGFGSGGFDEDDLLIIGDEGVVLKGGFQLGSTGGGVDLNTLFSS